MNQEQLKCLLDAASAARLDPSNLKAVNPWTQQGKVAEAMQMAVTATNPQIAASWRVEAGESASLGSIAAKAGLLEMTKAQHQELMELDSDYRTGVEEAQARREADLLASMEKEAAKLTEARESRSRRSARRAQSYGEDLSGSHNSDFLKRIGGIQNMKMPARKLIPGN